MMYDASFGPHGTMHVLSAGVFGCNLLNPLVASGMLSADEKELFCSIEVGALLFTFPMNLFF